MNPQNDSTITLGDNSVKDGPATNCLFCASALTLGPRHYFDTRFGHDSLYAVKACPCCGVVQTLPRPTPDDLKKLYERYYNFGGEHDTIYTRLRRRLFQSVLFRIWMRLDSDISFYTQKGHGRLLDVGCNEGRGLVLYRQNGFDVEGLELNEKAAAQARKAGFTVHAVALEDLLPSWFDVVVLSHVLEHAPDPRTFLSQVHSLLRPQGQLWVSCPNVRSWQKTLFGRYWINWHVPFHLSHFSAGQLDSLFEECGYTVIKRKQASPSLWMAQSLISLFFSRRGRPTREMRKALLVAGLMIPVRFFLFPFLWAGNISGRGDCLLFQVKRK
jgi:SAM-dependent methyltransferase